MNSSGGNGGPRGSLPTNLFSEMVVDNPFPLFAQLRSAGAVVAMPTPIGPEEPSAWLRPYWSFCALAWGSAIWGDYIKDEAIKDRGALYLSLYLLTQPLQGMEIW